MKLPKFALSNDRFIVLTYSGYASRCSSHYRGFPVVWGDPFKFDNNRYSFSCLEKGNYPKVGFCGQVEGSAIKTFLRLAQRTVIYIKDLVMVRKFTDPIIPPTYIRKKILDKVHSSSEISTSFVLRNKYKGGAKKGTNFEKQVKADYYSNIQNNHYTICVRGQGNFSIRFFDTLAMGRIPILIDTDCILPYKDEINYENHCLIVKSANIHELNDRIIDHFNSLSQADFRKIQESNRKLWEKYFQTDNFLYQTMLDII